MCQTAVISDKIVKLGTRSYQQRIEVAAGMGYSAVRLSRLNADLDKFYELLYHQINSITPADYKIFGPQLRILITTVKDLYFTCKKLSSILGLSSEIHKLERNYSALHEIESDIRNFRLDKDPEISSLLTSASFALANIVK